MFNCSLGSHRSTAFAVSCLIVALRLLFFSPPRFHCRFRAYNATAFTDILTVQAAGRLRAPYGWRRAGYNRTQRIGIVTAGIRIDSQLPHWLNPACVCVSNCMTGLTVRERVCRREGSIGHLSVAFTKLMWTVRLFIVRRLALVHSVLSKHQRQTDAISFYRVIVLIVEDLECCER